MRHVKTPDDSSPWTMKVLKNTTIGSPGKLPELSRPHGYLFSQMSKRKLLHPVFTFGLIVSETRWIGGVQSHRGFWLRTFEPLLLGSGI